MNNDFDFRGETMTGSGPANPSVHYEAQDVQAETILRYLLALLLTVVAAQILVWGVYQGLALREGRAVPLPLPLRQGVGRMLPPDPRLQGAPGHETSPQEDFRRMRDEAEARLNSYGWVDEKAGIARIPIKEAMRRLAGMGLGAGITGAETGSVPSVESVNSANSGEKVRP